MGDIVPRKEVERDGIRGFGGVAAGIGLLVLSSLGTVVGVVAGAALTAVGLGISSAGRRDKLAGGVAAAAGILTILSKVLHLGGGVLFAGGLGLLVFGGYSLYNFFRKLKARS